MEGIYAWKWGKLLYYYVLGYISLSPPQITYFVKASGIDGVKSKLMYQVVRKINMKQVSMNFTANIYRWQSHQVCNVTFICSIVRHVDHHPCHHSLSFMHLLWLSFFPMEYCSRAAFSAPNINRQENANATLLLFRIQYDFVTHVPSW